jgi:hypothetical protein
VISASPGGGLKEAILKYHPVRTILKYHTVRTILKYHTVRTILKYHTIRTILKYHTVRTILKYHTVRTIIVNSCNLSNSIYRGIYFMITTRFFCSGIYIILHSMNIGKQNHIFIITITSQIYLSIYLYDHIISLRGEVYNPKNYRNRKKSIPLTHKYMTTHCPSLVQTLQSGRVKLVLWAQTSPLSEMIWSYK